MSSSTTGYTVDELLSRFPGPITLYPSRAKWRFLTAGAAAFTAVAIFLSVFAPMDAVHRILMIFGAIFFGSCMLLGVITLLPGAASLQLDKDGFEIVKFYRKRRLRWAEVGDFSIWAYRQARVVTFNTDTPSSSNAGALLMKMNSLLARRNEYLPDTYGLSATDFLELVNAWRNRAIEPLPPDAITFVSRVEHRGTQTPSRAPIRQRLMQLDRLSLAGLFLFAAIFVAALVVFISSVHAPNLSPPIGAQADILSEHGPRRVSCDAQWSDSSQSNVAAYRDFLLRCMKVGR
jgi:hypothetical protein